MHANMYVHRLTAAQKICFSPVKMTTLSCERYWHDMVESVVRTRTTVICGRQLAVGTARSVSAFPWLGQGWYVMVPPAYSESCCRMLWKSYIIDEHGVPGSHLFAWWQQKRVETGGCVLLSPTKRTNTCTQPGVEQIKWRNYTLHHSQTSGRVSTISSLFLMFPDKRSASIATVRSFTLALYWFSQGQSEQAAHHLTSRE